MPTSYCHRPEPGPAPAGASHRPAGGGQPPPLPPRGPVLYWPAVYAAAGASVLLLAGLAVVLAFTPSPRRAQVAPAAASVGALDQGKGEGALAAPVASDPPRVEAAPAKRNEVVREPAAELPAAQPPAPAAKKPVPVVVKDADVCPTPTALLGTAVEFVDSPAAAARAAARQNKLLYVLHVSGNFEDPGFT